tara:strand:+ start:1800 stop:2090 length:291 start_codon:yes stop_codon:yes gene_type:complete
MLQEALAYFNIGKHQWYGWKNSQDGEVYSNLKLNDDTATMPSESDVNAKIAELQVAQNRRNEYPSIEDQLDYIYHNGLTKWKSDIIKPVKDKHPKP